MKNFNPNDLDKLVEGVIKTIREEIEAEMPLRPAYTQYDIIESNIRCILEACKATMDWNDEYIREMMDKA